MNVEYIIKVLTIEEKVLLLVGAGLLPKTVPGASGETRAIPRLNIHSIVLSDGPASTRAYPARLGSSSTYITTAFPNEILLASTWNVEIVEKVGRAIGEEAKEYGVDVILAPGLNMQRVPLCGRIFEYFSEDPLLSGKMAAAFVKGVQSVGVGATLKHLVANEQETNRMIIDTIVSERALREVYLRAFEVAIEESKPWAIMAAYNKLNGKYCTQNAWLLTKVLREDWKYDGLVMTDWFAGDDPIEQVQAGIDLIMPGDDGVVQTLLDAYRRNLLKEETINNRVTNVLKLIAKTPKDQGYKPSCRLDLETHREVAYEAALEGFVLLKNERALPINSEARVAVFGLGSYYTVKGGLGSGGSYPRHVVTIIEGLKDRGAKIDEELDEKYRSIAPKWYVMPSEIDFVNMLREARIEALRESSGEWLSLLMVDFTESMFEALRVMHIPEDFFDDEFLNRIASKNDVALITISRVSSESYDRLPLKGDYYLRDDELNLVERVSQAFHRCSKKVVVVLNVPGPIDIVSWRDYVDAIIVAWLPGQEAGKAIADVILGKASPSGKLPLTWPRDLYETPAMKNYPGEPRNNPVKIVYEEGIYVGYRYYDTFNVEPAYEFGYGISYTDFEYKDLEIEKEGDHIKIRLKVKNIGEHPGREVVQVYVKSPRGGMEKPAQELKGFHKTRLLNPKEEEIVEISIPIKYLASFNGSIWIVEKGVYEFKVGASSRRIKLSGSIVIEDNVYFDVSWKPIKLS